MNRRIIALGLAAAAFAATPASSQSPPPREWSVGASTRRFVPQGAYNWRGAATKALVTRIWYPAATGTSMSRHDLGPPEAPLFRLGEWADDGPPGAGRFPLIALSHGTGGSAEIMSWLARGLASRGYIVAAVNHPGNNALELYTAEGFLIWWERARDLTTVIDFLLRDRVLGSSIDTRRIGAAGFSLGGYTVLEIAGARTDPALFQKFCSSSGTEGCGDPPEFPNLFARWKELEATSPAFRQAVGQAGRSYRDTRVRAVFAIAPALGPAFIPASLRRISAPIAIVAGADDRMAPAAWNAQLIAELTPRSTLTILPAVGHYTFLAACTDAGRRAQAQLCADGAAVDRESVHQRVIDSAGLFFGNTLQ